MSRKRHMKKFIGALVIVCLGLCAYLITVYAAPQNTRGRIAIDLGTFQEQGVGGSGPHGLETHKYGYCLWYRNRFFSDRHYDGVTYRSKKSYDMTDVKALEFFAFGQTSEEHKIMVYSTSGDNITYQSRDFDDVNNKMYGDNPKVDGKVYRIGHFSTQYNAIQWSHEYKKETINVTDSYENRYIYVGLSHGIVEQKVQFYFGNSTYDQEKNEGSIALILKEHKITLLYPEDNQQRIKECTEKYWSKSNNEDDYQAYINLSLKLNDGKTYAANVTGGSVYRDEKIVFGCEYTGEAPSVRLTGYKIYADKDRNTLLYTLTSEELNEVDDVKTSSGTIQASNTINFNSQLIQKIEKASGKDLGDFYIEPIFEPIKVSFSHAAAAVNQTNVKIGNEISDTYGYKYPVYEVDDDGKQHIMGYIRRNKANRIGDYLWLDYEANRESDSRYAVSTIYVKHTDSEANVPTASDNSVNLSSITSDYRNCLSKQHVWISVGVRCKPTLTLEDKTVTFNNHSVEIDPPSVSYDLSIGKAPIHIKDIEYKYYADENLTSPLTAPPTEAGSYYVKATMEGDDNYVNSESNVAKLTIEKAVPKVMSAIGTTITYGESLEKSTLTGTVVGVTGSPITGTLEWKNKDQCPDAGVQKEAIKFTPDEKFAKNYTTYEDKGTTKSGIVTVKAATAVLVCTEETVVYDGEEQTYQSVKTYLKDDEQIPENEITVPLNYTYYSDALCSSSSKLEDAPKDVGTYYVKVSIPSGCNYNKTTSKDGKLTITPAQVNLIHVPMGETYDIYLRGVFEDLPNGKIQLEVKLGEASQTYQADIQRKEDRVCAVFDTAEIMPEAAEEYTITASYVPDTTKVQNYSISENTWTYKKGEAKKPMNLYLEYGKEDEYSYESDWNRDFFDSQYTSEDNVQITWLWDKNTDVIRVTDSTDGSLNKKFEAQNAGEAHVLGYVKKTLTTEETGETKYQSYYVMYNITVEPMTPTVELNGKEKQVETFDGTVKLYNGTATVTGKKFGKIDWTNPTDPWEDEDITDKVVLTYRYFHGTNLMTQEYPVEVGTYSIEARSSAARNYNAACSNSKYLVIEPAKPSIDMDNGMVTYDGTSKTLNAEAKPTVSKKTQNDEEADVAAENVEWWPVTGEISYKYQKIGENTTTTEAPKDVGIYLVTATVSKSGNYAEASTTALLSINPTRMSIEAKDKTVVYNGQKVSVDIVCTVNGKTVKTPNNIEYQYLRSGDSEDMATTEPPTDAGVYYVKAILNDDNYIATESNTAVLTIQKAQPTVTIPSTYQKTYDGKPAVVASTVVKVNNVDMTDQFEVKYSYYEEIECKTVALTPENAGTYYAKAFVKEQTNYKAAESNVQTVVIEKAQPVVTLPEPIVVPYIGAEISLREAVVMVNGEDLTDDFYPRYTFYADAAGSEEIGPPTKLGTYYVKAFVDERTNYKAAESDIQSVTIEEIEVTVVIPETISKTYDGTPLLVEDVLVFVNDNNETENFDVNYVYYSDEACTQVLVEMPKDASVYYAKAFIDATEYFKAAESNVAKLTIEKAQPTVTIPDVIKKTYDGTPITVNSAKVKVDETDMTDAFNVTYVYYSDEACTQRLDEAPIQAGTYWVKAFVEEQTNYKSAESLVQKIIIEQESESETESGDNGGNETEPGGDGGNETETGGDGGNETETEPGGNGGNETETGGDGGNETETEPGGNGGNETEPGGNGGNETETDGDGGNETETDGDGGNETETGGNGGNETEPGGNGGNETETGGNGGNETKPGDNGGDETKPGGNGGDETKPGGSSGSNNGGTGSSDSSSVKTGDTSMIQVALSIALLSLAVSVITGRRSKNE